MKRVLVSLKKTMVSALAFVMAASLAMPMPAMAAATKDETQTETFGLRDVNREQGGRGVVYDFGLVGRSPVGTQAVSDDVAFDPNGGAAEVARSVLGKDADLSGSYYKVFKRCIDRLSKSTIPDLELLDPRVAAYLSGCAADANGARGVMVSLQAALEHLAAYSDVDPRRSPTRSSTS